MGFDVRNIDLSDIARAGKQGVKVDTSYSVDVKTDEKNPLKGITGQQRTRNRNIGSELRLLFIRPTVGFSISYGVKLAVLVTSQWNTI